MWILRSTWLLLGIVNLSGEYIFTGRARFALRGFCFKVQDGPALDVAAAAAGDGVKNGMGPVLQNVTNDKNVLVFTRLIYTCKSSMAKAYVFLLHCKFCVRRHRTN